MENPASWTETTHDIQNAIDEHKASQESGAIGGSLAMYIEQKVVDPLKLVLSLAQDELKELESTFDLRWKADMRAINRWKEAHPEKPNTWPDRTDMVVWLLEEQEKMLQPMTEEEKKSWNQKSILRKGVFELVN